jgi:hypothetical protein
MAVSLLRKQQISMLAFAGLGFLGLNEQVKLDLTWLTKYIVSILE